MDWFCKLDPSISPKNSAKQPALAWDFFGATVNCATVLAAYLRNRLEELKPWAEKNGITCFRLYERDLTAIPAIVDWYDGDVVVWVYPRSEREPEKQQNNFRHETLLAVSTGLKINHKHIYMKQRHIQQEGRQYQRHGQESKTKVVAEQGLKFEVNLSDYVDTGLFLDHRVLRARVRSEAKDKRVLNLFAYTGAFTCYALAGGAAMTTTVDLSSTYSEWTKRNFTLNDFRVSDKHRVYEDDTMEYLRRAARRSERYDLIVCDPPTFSRSKRTSKDFSVARDYPTLIAACLAVLSPGGVLYFSNNARQFKLDPAVVTPGLTIKDCSLATIPQDFQNQQIHYCFEIKVGGKVVVAPRGIEPRLSA